MTYNPIQPLSEYIKIFRDDLYPFLGGGNKGRKMDAIAQDIFQNKSKALVTTGGVQSNHCRAVAVFAASQKLKCTLVLHGSKEHFENLSGNAKIMRMSGAEIVFADHPQNIGELMDAAMNRYEKASLKPYYIWGGGHTIEGGYAYIDAISELKSFADQNNWIPDFIFLASGTGSTQSGILAGLDKFGFNSTKVVGVSVARKSEPASKIVRDFYESLCKAYKIQFSDNETLVLDDYLCGGYEQYNDELKQISDNSIKNYGFPLDTCYSGKAFYGMLDYIKKNKIDRKNILFWHTGGVFNFLA